MRIALITPGFSSPDDDWCIPALRNLAVGLGARHDVVVYAASYPRISAAYRVETVEVRAFGGPRRNRLAAILRHRRLCDRLSRDHLASPFDVVHGFWADQGGLLAAKLRRLLGIPALMSVMAGELDYVPEASYGRRWRLSGRMGRRAASVVDCIATLSEFHESRLRRSLYPLEITCLPFGVDTTLFRPGGQRMELGPGTNLLIVGSLVSVKGHAAALSAVRLARNRHPSLRLHVVGDGPLRGELEDLARHLEIFGSVVFHGHVRHDALPAYYRSADLCLLSSWFETSGMVVIEAAACGRMTAGADVGTMPELIPASLRCKPGDSVALSEVVDRYLGQRDAYRHVERELVERVNEDYSLSAMVERYETEYRRLARRAEKGHLCVAR